MAVTCTLSNLGSARESMWRQFVFKEEEEEEEDDDDDGELF